MYFHPERVSGVAATATLLGLTEEEFLDISLVVKDVQDKKIAEDLERVAVEELAIDAEEQRLDEEFIKRFDNCHLQ